MWRIYACPYINLYCRVLCLASEGQMLQYTVNLWAHELKTRNLNTEHPDPAHFAQCDTSGYCVHR